MVYFHTNSYTVSADRPWAGHWPSAGQGELSGDER